MQKKQLFFAGVILFLIAAGWGYYQYQKPRAGAANVTAAFKLSSEQLYKEYSTNETAADEKYSNKILEVTGPVADVQITPQATNVLLAATATGGVNCSIMNGETRITKGERITVKGRCTGFLMDVSLVDAVQVNNLSKH